MIGHIITDDIPCNWDYLVPGYVRNWKYITRIIPAIEKIAKILEEKRIVTLWFDDADSHLNKVFTLSLENGVCYCETKDNKYKAKHWKEYIHLLLSCPYGSPRVELWNKMFRDCKTGDDNCALSLILLHR